MQPRDDHQEGATSILAALGTTLVLLAATLAIDLGSTVLTQRDLQGAVDLAALDAVMALPVATDPAALADEYARQSLERNSGWSARDGRSVTVTVGTYDQVTRVFTPGAVGGDAVLVEATTDASRLTGVLPGTDRVTRSAVAMLDGQGAVSIGTAVASIGSDRSVVLNRLLSRLFGRSSDLSLDVAGYQGLASGTVSLRQLAADLGLASPEELTDTTVSVGNLFSAAATGLSASGDPLDLSAATPMSTLAAEVGTNQQVRLGDVLDLEAGRPGAVADLEVAALDLVSVVAQVVNGDNVVDLGLPIAVPGVGSGTLTLAVLEPPQIAAGRAGIDPVTGAWRTVATTAQVRLAVDLTLAAVSLPGLTVSAIDLPVTVDAARGDAPLESVTCSTAGANPHAVLPVATSAVTTTVGQLPTDLVGTSAPVPAVPVDLASVQLTLPLLGSLDLGSLTAVAQHDVAGATETLSFTGPYAESQRTAGASSLGGTPRVPGSGGSGRVGLAAALDTATLGVTLLTAGVDLQTDVLDPVLDATTPVLDEVDRRVVGPVLESLGVSLGRADVTVSSVDCAGRWLVR